MVTIVSLASIEAFQSFLSDKGFGQNTTRAYVTDVRLLFSTGIKADEIPMAELETAMERWLSANRSSWEARTLMRKRTSLRKFMEFLGEKNALEDYRTPRAPEPDPHPLPNGLQDLERMFSVAENLDQTVLIALCGLVGLRISEALAVEVDDIDIKERVLHVRGKGDVVRRVPLSPRAYRLIFNLYAEKYVSGGGTLLTYNERSARRIITQLGQRAGIARSVASHDLRATFATMAYAKSKDILAVSRLLGHSNVKTTMIYIGTAREDMRAAASFAEEEE